MLSDGARKVVRGGVIALAITTVAGAVAVGAGAAWAFKHASRVVTERAQKAIDDGDAFKGTVGTIDLDLARLRGSISGLHLEATAERMVLRELKIDSATFSIIPSWGLVRLDAAVDHPTIMLRRRPPGLALEGLGPLPDPGFWRWNVDAAVTDGVFVWTDPLDPSFALTLEGVNGDYNGLGTADHAGRLDVAGATSSGDVIEAHADLDFFNAHHDAVDLELTFHDVDIASLGGAAKVYAGVDVPSGTLNGRVGITIDEGRQELPVRDVYAAGPVADLQQGLARVDVELSDFTVEGLPFGVEVQTLGVDFTGPMNGDAPLTMKAVAQGVRLQILQSKMTEQLKAETPGATPGQVLEALPRFESSEAHATDVKIIWVDDTHQPPVRLASQPLELHLDHVQNLRPDEPAVVSLSGELMGGTMAADGTIGLLRWPPPTILHATLSDVQAPRFSDALSDYTAAIAHRGTIQGVGTFEIGHDGTIQRTLTLDATDLAVSAKGWNVEASAAHVDVFPGSGWIRSLHLVPDDPTGPIRDAKADRGELEWDMDQFIADRRFLAKVHVTRPSVIAQRPTPVAGGAASARPSAAFRVDVKVTEGRLEFHDTTVTPATHVVLDPFNASVERLGTLSDSATWKLDGSFARGGTLEGTAELDAFAGPGRSAQLHANATIDNVDLSQWVDASTAYIGVRPYAGTGRATLSMTPTGGTFGVDLVGTHLVQGATTLDGARTNVRVQWDDTIDNGGKAVSGSIEGATLTLDVEALSALEGNGDAFGMPTLTVPYFDIRGATVVLEKASTTGESIVIDHTNVAIRKLTLGALDESGQVWVDGQVFGGDVNIQLLAKRTAAHQLLVRVHDIEVPQTNPWLRSLLGIDAHAGRVDVQGTTLLDPLGFHGGFRVALRGVEVLERDDWRKGLGTGLKNAAIGAVLDLASKDGVGTLQLEMGGTPTALDLRPVATVLDAILVRHGLREEDVLEMRAPAPIPLEMPAQDATASP